MTRTFLIKPLLPILCLILSLLKLSSGAAYFEEEEFTTLTTQASISVINNRGNMGRVLQELGSQQNLRALAISMATAGLTQGVLGGLDALQADPAALTQTGATASQAGSVASQTGAALSEVGSVASQAGAVSQTAASQAASLMESIDYIANQALHGVSPYQLRYIDVFKR